MEGQERLRCLIRGRRRSRVEDGPAEALAGLLIGKAARPTQGPPPGQAHADLRSQRLQRLPSQALASARASPAFARQPKTSMSEAPEFPEPAAVSTPSLPVSGLLCFSYMITAKTTETPPMSAGFHNWLLVNYRRRQLPLAWC